MKRIVNILTLTALLLLGVGGSGAAAQSKPKAQSQQSERKPIDIKSRRTRPVPVGDSTGYALVGDVVLYHNGSVITCDSVVRYSDRQMSCFGNVIIRKDDTFIYGDRAEYSRDEGMARVYSPLIKVYNGDATLYTYNLLFNTADNVGEFYGGGTFTNGTNLMESERGYFFADLDEVVGVDNVELKNETYQLKSDSVNYNSESEVARYFTRSVTWKDDSGEMLSSDEGEYHNKDERYIFRSNAYIMGEKQEMWADTIDYKSLIEFIELKHNGQIRDEEHQSIIFGNYGNHDNKKGDTFLTDNPAFISYGDSDGDGVGDTVYMRSDSMYVYLIDSLGYCTLTRPDSATLAAELAAKAQRIRDSIVADSMAKVKVARDAFLVDSLTLVCDSLATIEQKDSLTMRYSDSLQMVISRLKPKPKQPPVDTLATDSLAVGTLTDSLDRRFAKRANAVGKMGGLPEQPQEQIEEPTQPVDAEDDGQPDRIMLGLNNVKIFRADFQGVCDSVLMFSADSTAQLHRNSVMWNELNQIVSERADVYTRNKKPTRVLFSEGKPLMSSELDTTRYNQIAGKTIESLFDAEGVMYQTNVDGNAQTYYYMVDDADGAVMGFLVAESSDITFYIEDNTVVGIMYRGSPVYTIYPMDQIPEEQPERMPNFVWYIERKPTREQIVGDWRINPSERERYMSMKRPQFPITYAIERHRESLVSGGRWADRTDDISDMAKEFIDKVKED